ncbi:MAG: site-specific tyrosine recombinase/integron integrase [Thermoplasmata archaeon]
MATAAVRVRVEPSSRRSRGTPRPSASSTEVPPPYGGEETIGLFERRLRAQERSPCTVKQYTHIARMFFRFVAKPIDEVTTRDLDAFREYLVLQRHYSKNSLYTTIRGLTCLFRSFGLTLAGHLEAPRRPERLPHYLNEEEMHRLFGAVAASPRNAAIVNVLGYSGLRVGELCHLELDDLDLDRNVLHVRSGKGDKDREVVLDERARSSVDRYLADRTVHGGTASTRLFPVGPVTVERLVRAAARSAGIDRRVTPHMLRHSLATALLSRGCDIRYIQKLLGHSSVATTQIYTHVDTQSLRAAYERARPQY